jgi:uncharacterized protein YndB with AHSA1/START domain
LFAAELKAMAEHGHLLIADITGYTKFLTGTELDHAQGILESLFAVILERLKAPLALSNIQGDAFFAFANDQAVGTPAQILDSIEALYFGFRDRVFFMQENNSCTCRACSNIGKLDLKFVVHHGNYVVNVIANRQELTGADVILVHRLLKNDVAEKTGVAAYALFTAASVKALDLAELQGETVPYSTGVAEFGTVAGAVLDLGARWQTYHAQNVIVVSEDEPLFFEPVNRTIPGNVETVWRYVSEPALRLKWQYWVDAFSRDSNEQRLRSGVAEHCAHGKESLTITYLDVRPLRHVTAEVPMPLNGRVRYSIVLTPDENGTRISVRIARPISPNPLASFALKMLAGTQSKKERALWVSGLERLEGLIRHEPSAAAVPAASLTADEIGAVARSLAA